MRDSGEMRDGRPPRCRDLILAGARRGASAVVVTPSVREQQRSGRRRWPGDCPISRDCSRDEGTARLAPGPLRHSQREVKPTFRGFVRALWPLVSNQAGRELTKMGQRRPAMIQVVYSQLSDEEAANRLRHVVRSDMPAGERPPTSGVVIWSPSRGAIALLAL
jgi:hypothetical protein